MTEPARIMRRLQIAAIVVMVPTLAIMWGHLAFGWFRDESGGNVWYYPLTTTAIAFFAGVQLWVFRSRSKTP